VKYGYINVGVVEAGPAELVGKRVFSLAPHQTRSVLPSTALSPLPESLPSERAVQAANKETAQNGVWDADVRPGDRVTVVGAGTVGCLVAWLAARIPGCEVCLVDVNRTRASIAAALNARFIGDNKIPADQDVVIHASGTAAGLSAALAAAAFEATVLEMSWFGTREIALPLGEAFHSRRLTIKASQVGHVALAQRSRWDYRRRMRMALTLLASAPELDVLITGESPFDQLPDVMCDLATGARDALCHRIRY
jgi:threonine dehydrogenase-like Zn-dependent dehydrogenase